MEKFYIQKKDKVITGPFAIEQLQPLLRSAEKIWYQGLDEWKRPQQIDLLRDYFATQHKPGFLSRFLGAR